MIIALCPSFLKLIVGDSSLNIILNNASVMKCLYLDPSSYSCFDLVQARDGYGACK